MNRFVLGSLLVACLLVLSAYHAVNHDLHKAYPENEGVIYGATGTVSVGGTVVHSSDGAFTLRLMHAAASKVITIVSPVPVASGDKVEVLGVLTGDELIPEEMIVSKKWAHHAIYLRSLLGLALVLFVFARYWTFDRRRLRFMPKRKREEEKRNA
jgi:hypothetical protein